MIIRLIHLYSGNLVRWMRLSITVSLLILILSCFFLIQSASALRVYLRPPKMVVRVNVTSDEPTTIERFLEVYNNNTETVNVSFQPRGDIAEITNVEQNITLEPNETRKVDFVVEITEPGTYNGKITVTYSLGQMPAVGLDAEIIIFATGPENPVTTTPTETTTIESNPLTGNVVLRLSWIHIGIIFLIVIILFVVYMRMR